MLALFLALGALNVYGVRTTDAVAVANGYELRVRYAKVSRGGLATPWSAEVTRTGGFVGDTVTLATTASYFDIFDENGLDPEPTESVSDGERILWSFAVPADSNTFTVSFDARVEPAVQLETAQATTSILVAGVAAVSVDYKTFVMP